MHENNVRQREKDESDQVEQPVPADTGHPVEHRRDDPACRDADHGGDDVAQGEDRGAASVGYCFGDQLLPGRGDQAAEQPRQQRDQHHEPECGMRVFYTQEIDRKAGEQVGYPLENPGQQQDRLDPFEHLDAVRVEHGQKVEPQHGEDRRQADHPCGPAEDFDDARQDRVGGDKRESADVKAALDRVGDVVPAYVVSVKTGKRLFVASRTDFTVVHGVGGGGGIGRMRGNGKPAYAEARVWQVHRQECDGGASVQFHLLPAQIYNGAGCGRPCGHAGPVIQTVQGLRGRSAAQNSGMAR